MGNKNQTYTQTIRYNSEVDVSNVLKALQKIRSELGKSEGLSGKEGLFKNVDKELANLEKMANKFKLSMTNGFSSSDDIKNFKKLSDAIEKSISDISVEFQGLDSKRLTNEIAKAKKEMEDFKKSIRDVVNAQSRILSGKLEVLGSKQANSTIEQIKQMAREGKKYEDVQKAILKTYEDQIAAKKESIKVTEKELEIQKNGLSEVQGSISSERIRISQLRSESAKKGGFGLTGGVGRWTPQSFEYTSGENKGQKISKEDISLVRNLAHESMAIPNKTAAFADFTKKLKELGITYSNAQRAQSTFNKSFNFVNEKAKENGTILNNLTLQETNYKRTINDTNTELAKRRAELTKLKGSEQEVNVLTQTGGAVNQSYDAIFNVINQSSEAERKYLNLKNQEARMYERITPLQQQIRQGLRNINNENSEAGKIQENFNNTFERLRNYIQYTFSLANGFRALKRVITQTFNDVKELDKAFASIAMVTNYSVADMWAQYSNYAKIANDLGQATKDVVASSALFYQQGN